jgi:hypothetical protein
MTSHGRKYVGAHGKCCQAGGWGKGKAGSRRWREVKTAESRVGEFWAGGSSAQVDHACPLSMDMQ